MAGDPVTMSIGMGALQGIAGGSAASRQAMLRGMQANSQYNDSVVRGELQRDLANMQKAEQRRAAGEQQRSQFVAAYKNAVLNNSVMNEQESIARRDLSRYRASQASMKMRMQGGGSKEAYSRTAHNNAMEQGSQLFQREYAREASSSSQLDAVLNQKLPVIMDDTFIPGSKPIIDDPRAAGKNAFISGAISGAMQGYSLGSQIQRNSLQIPE